MQAERAPSGEGVSLPEGLAVFRRFLRHVGHVELVVAIACLVVVVVLSAAQAMLRYLFGTSLWWSQDLMQVAIITSYFLGVSYVFKTRQYILIEFMVNMTPIRVQLLCYLVAQVLTAVFAVATIYLLYLFLPNMLAMRTPMLNLPGWLTPAPMGVASALMVVTTAYYFLFGLWALANRVEAESMTELERMALIEEPLEEVE